MTPFDPILHDHEKRMKLLEASRREMEDQLIVMAARDRRLWAKMQEFEDFVAGEVQYQLERAREQKEHERQVKEWQARHELIMREFDEKLNALITWWDDFIKRSPQNGK